ncbi:hypothetical protein [Pirellulimonas nuda]|nr:hypothetical protein [Pirellulimonas nuda]
MACAVGCGQRDPDYAAVVRQCAALPTARASSLAPLRGQIEQIEADGGLPLQMAQRAAMGRPFPTLMLHDQQRLSLGQELDAYTPGDRFTFDFETLSEVQKWLKNHKLLLDRVDTATGRLEGGPTPRFEQGFFDQMASLDDAAIAARALLLRGAVRLANNDAAGAASDVAASLAWSDALAKTARIETRALAGLLRAEALLAAEEVTWSAACTTAEIDQLYAALRESLDGETGLREPLLGERAVVLHAYEAVQAGLLDKLVTDEEKKSLNKRGLMANWRSASSADIEADELAYLEAIGWVIEQSRRPLSEWRKPLVDRLELLPAGTLAKELFFRDLPDAMQLAYDDRARREAAAVGLATAGGLQLPPYRENPANGVAYEARRQQDRVRILCGAARLHDPEFRIIERPTP